MQGVQGPRAVRAARGVSCRWCAAQGGGAMCSCEVVCVGMARVSRGEKRAPRACAGCGPSIPPRPPRGETRCVCVCVCVCATQPGAGCGVWVQLVRRLRGREGRARCDATQPVVDRRLRSAACVCACVRRAEGEGAARASWSHKCLRAGAHYQRTKRKPTGGCARSQRGGRAPRRGPPIPSRGGACPSAARVRTKKKKCPKGGCTWVHRSRGGI